MSEIDIALFFRNFMASPPDMDPDMATIRLPETDGIASATVVRWLVQPGAAVAKGQALVELAAETAQLQVESPCEGELIAAAAGPGTTLTPGGVLGELRTVVATTSPPSQGTAASSASASPPASRTMTASPSNVTPILMPEAGNSMEEGTILAWKVKPGDAIAAGQLLCEIETDKATMEYESPVAGRLARIVVGEGDSIAVKQPIAYLADDDAAVDAWLAQSSGDTESVSVEAPRAQADPTVTPAAPAQASTPVGTSASRPAASPAARKLAKDNNLDLAAVGAGSGPHGRILTTDLASAPASAAAPTTTGAEIRRPMSRMRRAIAANLQQSKQTVPHFYVRTTIDADPLLAFYKAHKPATGCSVNDVIVAAVALAMKDFPAVRSRVADNDLIEFPHANIGVAVGVPDGLVVPVVMAADRMPLSILALETKRIVEAARNGKPENMGKGNFTISNLGMFGVEEFAAIINPPESAILAVAAARETVIVKNGAMRPGRVMTMTLSVDHRVVDGLLAAQFLARLKEILERPDVLAV